MNILEDIPFTELLKLYQLKKESTKSGDLNTLLLLKKKFPDLFTKKTDEEVKILLFYIKTLSADPAFLEIVRQNKKEKFFVLDIPNWKIGMLDDFIHPLKKISFNLLPSLAKILVKEAVAICIQLVEECDPPSAQLEKFFPLLGILLGLIVLQFPQSKHARLLESVRFKLINQKNPLEISAHPAHADWKSEIKNYLQLEKTITNFFTEMLNKIKVKFDQRKDFYLDRLSFTLIYISEFVSLLCNDVAKSKDDSKEIVVKRICDILDTTIEINYAASIQERELNHFDFA